MQLTARGSPLQSAQRWHVEWNSELNVVFFVRCKQLHSGAETVYLRGDMYRTRSYHSSSNLYVSFLRLDESHHNIKAIPIRQQVDVLVVYAVSCTTAPSSSFRDRAQ
jgi:hypothetical protein